MTIKTALGKFGKAVGSGFTPRSNLPRSDVQGAVEYVMDNAENVGTVYAPTDAQYLTSASSAGLSNERVVGDTATIVWDFTGIGTAEASLQHLGIEDLADPGADRGMFWDDSAGVTTWFTPAGGLEFVGTNLSITDPDLAAIVQEASFALGDILYHDGTTLTRLAAGTDGQFLRTRGTAAAPDWQNISGGGDLLRANNLSDLASAATARTNLGVAIGTNVQAWDAQLDEWATVDPSENGKSLVAAADYAAMKVLLDLEIGTDLQAWSTHLDSIAALARTDGNVIVGNGTTWVAESGATARTSLGVGTGDSPQFTAVSLSSGTGLTVGSSIPFSDTAGTLTLQNVDALDATTEATIEAAIDTLGNLGSIQGVAFTFGSYAATLLNNTSEATFKAAVNLEIGTDVQAYSAVLANTTASFVTADETKLDYLTVTGATDLDTIRTKAGFITVTQAVDLDAMESSITALDQAIVLKGTWDASAGTFPGGGAAQAGWKYIVSVAGTVDGVAFVANDTIVAIVDNASTATYAANWHLFDHTDLVQSVAGRTGAVTIAVADITDMTANGRSLVSAANYAAMKVLLDLEIGTDLQAWDAQLDSLSSASANGVSLVTAADYAAMRALLDLEAGTDFLSVAAIAAAYQPLDELLTEIAALSTAPGADRGLFYDHSSTAVDYFTATNGIEFSTTNLQMTAAQRTRDIIVVIDGGGSAITTGVKTYLPIDFACTITQVTAVADQSGSIVVDVWKDTYANFPPTDADTITASAPVTISAATKAQDSTLTGWTTSIAAGDVLGFNVDSVTSITRLTITIRVTVT